MSIYVWCIQISTQDLACSQCQIRTVNAKHKLKLPKDIHTGECTNSPPPHPNPTPTPNTMCHKAKREKMKLSRKVEEREENRKKKRKRKKGRKRKKERKNRRRKKHAINYSNMMVYSSQPFPGCKT